MVLFIPGCDRLILMRVDVTLIHFQLVEVFHFQGEIKHARH